MKLLYKGSECGVPCTCPSAEEEYVWWTLMEGPETMTSDSTSWSTTKTTPVAVTPIWFRVTCNKPVMSVTFQCNASPNHQVRYALQNMVLDGQPFTCFSAEDTSFYIGLIMPNGVYTISDWAIAVSKEDYAKLVEASGS